MYYIVKPYMYRHLYCLRISQDGSLQPQGSDFCQAQVADRKQGGSMPEPGMLRKLPRRGNALVVGLG